MFNTFWGAVLLLHPFIIRLTGIRIWAYGGPTNKGTLHWVNNMLYVSEKIDVTRLGKDTFFLFATTLSITLFGGLSLPKVERGVFASFLCLIFLNAFDFISPSVFYQTIMAFMGVLFISHLYKNIDKGDTLLKYLSYSCLLSSFFIFLEYFIP